MADTGKNEKKKSPVSRSGARKTSAGSSAGKPKGSTRAWKKTGKTQPGSSVFPLVLIALGAVALILVFAIIVLDQRAMKSGKMGVWESVAGVRVAKSPDEVDAEITRTLTMFDISRRNLVQIGKAPDTSGARLIHKIYRVSDKEQWLRISKRLEPELEKHGVTTHNRLYQSSASEYRYVLYAGTPFERTHKIEVNCYSSIPLEIPIATSVPEPVPPEKSSGSDGPMIAICIDDFGSDLDIAHRFLQELKHPVTFAVIPGLQFSKLIIHEVSASRHDVFLHLPMEPENEAAMGDAAETFLTAAMTPEQISEKTRAILDALPDVDGVNNHMGSRLTADPVRMRAVLQVLKSRKLPFLDSRTTPDTVAASVAAELGVPHVSRAVFLDQGYKGGDVSANLDKLVEIARDKGVAVGIGHARAETLADLVRRLPEIEQAGVTVVPVRQLMSRDGS